jgi:hypothetical protein
MKKVLLSLSMLGLASAGLFGSSAMAADLPGPVVVAPGPVVTGYLTPPVILQIGPTTTFSTINCAEFVKDPDGSWHAVGTTPFGLGFVQGIIPPVRPIKVGGYIYNNIDLWSQLEEQCHGEVVKARY